MRRILTTVLLAIGLIFSIRASLDAIDPPPKPTDSLQAIGEHKLYGEIHEITEDGEIRMKATFSSSAYHKSRSVSYNTGQIRYMCFNIRGKTLPQPELQPCPYFHLIDGSIVCMDNITWENDTLTIKTSYSTDIKVPKRFLQFVTLANRKPLLPPENTKGSDFILWDEPTKTGGHIKSKIKCKILSIKRTLQAGREVNQFELDCLVNGKEQVIRGINFLYAAFNTENLAKVKKASKGFYAQVRMLNGNLLKGVLGKMKDGKIHLITQLMGEVVIDKAYVDEIYFTEKLTPDSEKLLICDSSNHKVMEFALELGQEPKKVWTYTMPGNGKPKFATHTKKDNILIVDEQNGGVYEVNHKKEIVWQIAGLDKPTCARRLPDGDTIISFRKAKPEMAYGRFNAKGQRIASYHSGSKTLGIDFFSLFEDGQWIGVTDCNSCVTVCTPKLDRTVLKFAGGSIHSVFQAHTSNYAMQKSISILVPGSLKGMGIPTANRVPFGFDKFGHIMAIAQYTGRENADIYLRQYTQRSHMIGVWTIAKPDFKFNFIGY